MYLAKNVQPSTWVYADYLTQPGFENPNTNYTILFAKAGTTDVWAFNDNEYMSQSSEDAMFLPQSGTKRAGMLLFCNTRIGRSEGGEIVQDD